MISNLWIELRKPNWNRLNDLTSQAERGGIKSLEREQLREFGLLYRQAAADLSAARSDVSARTLEQYLNGLVGRAHNFVYSGGRLSLAGLWHFFAYGYPRVLRRLSAYVLAATAICLLSGALGALITTLRPEVGAMMVGPGMMHTIEEHKMWTESVLSMKPQAASGIMTNNILVCFMTFAMGMLGGLGTVYLLFQNGMSVGVITALCAQHGMSLSIWSFMAAHGALEIPSIMFAGAAGLRLGTGMLFPGMLRRKESLARAGMDAVQLLSGTIPLLIVAGTLEGFLSPTHVPAALKFSVGAVLFTGLCLWLGGGGRSKAEVEP
jgi:uncharacterized membrane protein SpoIIM required for sporulation